MNHLWNTTAWNESSPGFPVNNKEFHPIVTIISASLSSTLENLLAISVGVVLSIPQLGLLSKKDVVQTISKMLLFVFLPFFIINSFCTSVDISHILDMWVILVISVVMHLLQYFFAEIFLLSFEGDRKSTQRMIPLMAMTYTNFTFIPMVFITSLCQNSNIFLVNNSAELAQIYVTLYAIPQRIFFYSFGIYFIKIMEVDEEETIIEQNQSEFINGNIQEQLPSRIDIENERYENKYHDQRTNLKWKKILLNIWKFFRSVFLSPPVLAVVIGLLITSIGPIKQFFFTSPPTVIKGIPNVIKKLGSIVLGLANIVTGANVGRLIFNRQKSSMKHKGGLYLLLSFFKLRYVDCWSVMKVCFVKLVFLPMMCLVLIGFFAIAFESFSIKDENVRSLMYMTVLVESMVPLMLSLNIVVSVYDNGIEILSEYLIAQYLIAPFTMTFFAVISLYFVCSFEKCNL